MRGFALILQVISIEMPHKRPSTGLVAAQEGRKRAANRDGAPPVGVMPQITYEKPVPKSSRSLRAILKTPPPTNRHPPTPWCAGPKPENVPIPTSLTIHDIDIIIDAWERDVRRARWGRAR